MTEKGVLLAFPHGGTVRAEFMTSVLRLLERETPVARWGAVFSGPMLSSARNRMSAEMLASDCEWLWMADTDVSFEPDVISVLLASAHPVSAPVVGAAYRVLHDGAPVVAAYRLRPGAEPLVPVPVSPGLTPVDATGCGCLLVHRSVLRALGPFAFTPLVLPDCPQEYGEDVSFCVRARNAGFPVHVNGAARVLHHKAQAL